MHLLYLIASLFLWLFFLFFKGIPFGIFIFVFLALFIVYLLFSKEKILPQKPLVLSRAILNISFWSCIALALKKYTDSLTCLNCMKSYLNTRLQALFNDDMLLNIKMIWQSYPRFLSVFGLLISWCIIFSFLQYKKGKIK